MSARLAARVEAPRPDAEDVHEWLEHIDGGIDDSAPGTSPLAKVCSSAVDPLEIAVALEVAGISHAVVTERYDRADVFSLARTLWNRIPLRPAPPRSISLPRSGGLQDLARGLLYAIPALMLLAATSALDLGLARWVLPLAISWGWGLGQVAAFVGYRMQAGEPSPQDANSVVLVIAGAAASTWLLSTIAAFTFGGGATSVGAATALVTYMIASAILLVRAEERWLALLLLPGTVASVVALAVSNEPWILDPLAATFIGGSFVAVVHRALRNARFGAGRGRALARHEVLVASGHVLHGVFCGLAVSLVVIQSGGASPANEFARMLVPMPLLATLGVMEWQLRSFRSRVAHLTRTLESSREFPRLAWYELLRSVAICAGSNAAVAIAALVAVQIRGGEIAVGALILQCALGAVFFTDLIVVLLDRLDLVLRSWLAALAIGCVAWVGISMFSESATDVAAYRAASVLVSVLLVSLLFHAHKVASAVMNY